MMLMILPAIAPLPLAQAAPPPKPVGHAPGASTEFGPEVDSLTPTFSWSAVSGASNYHLVVRKFQGSWEAGPIVVDQGYISGTSYVVPAGKLEAGASYRWNVRAFSSAGEGSDFSSRLYFRTPPAQTPPSAPAGHAPGSSMEFGPEVDSLTPTFSWSAVSGASNYHLVVRKHQGGWESGPIVVDQGYIPGTSYAVPAGKLEAGASYRWNVRAFNSAGQGGDFSGRLYFRTPAAQGPPPAPVGHAPGASTEFGPEIAELTPTFSWSSVAGASNYHLVVRKHQGSWESGPIVVDEGHLSGTSYTVPAGKLDAGASYRWNVRAFDASGQASDFSGRLYFRTAAPQAVPAAPIAHAPGATSEADAPALTGSAVFSWSGVPDATSYTLRISKKEYGSANVVLVRYGLPDTSVSIPLSELPRDATQFRWGVSAVNAAGEGAQSDVRYFRVPSPAPPAAPRTLGPGATTEETAPVLRSSATFSWEPVPGATSYTLRVSKKEYGASNIVLSRSGITGTSTTVELSELPADATQFRWGVAAANAAGESAQSDVRYFQVEPPLAPPPAPTLVAPGAASEGAAPDIGAGATFSWTPVGSASSYYLYVSRKPYGEHNLVLTRENLQGTSLAIAASDLPAGATQFRWGVKAHNAAGASPQSAVLHFRVGGAGVPPPPQPAGPGGATEDAAPVLAPTEVFSWEPVPGAASYTLRVSKKEYGSANVVLVKSGITDTRVAVHRDELPRDATQFRWGVTSVNAAGESDQSRVLYVRTEAASAPPARPTPLSPGSPAEADAPLVGQEVTFSWEPVAGAQSYTLRVSRQPYGEDHLVLTRAGLSKTSLTLPRSALPEEAARLRWGVTATNAAGESRQSDVRYFRTAPPTSEPSPADAWRAGIRLVEAPAVVTSGDPVWRIGVRNDGTAAASAGAVLRLVAEQPGRFTSRILSSQVPPLSPGEEHVVTFEPALDHGIVEASVSLLAPDGKLLGQLDLDPVFRGSPGSRTGPTAVVDGRALTPSYHPLLFEAFLDDFDAADPASVRSHLDVVPLLHVALVDERGALVRDPDTYARFLWSLLGADASHLAARHASAPSLSAWTSWHATRDAIVRLRVQAGDADVLLNLPSKLAQRGTSLLWGDAPAARRAEAELSWLLFGPDPEAEEREEAAQKAAEIIVGAAIFAGLANGLAKGGSVDLGSWRATPRADVDAALLTLERTSKIAAGVATAGEQLVALTGGDLPALAARGCSQTRDALVETASRAELLAVVVSAVEAESDGRARGFVEAARRMQDILDARARVLEGRAQIVCDPDGFEAALLAEFNGNAAPVPGDIRAFVDKYAGAGARIGTAVVLEHVLKGAIEGVARRAGLGPLPALAFLTLSGVGLLGNIGETAEHARIAEEAALLTEIVHREELLLDTSSASREGDLARRAVLLEAARRAFAGLAHEEAARLSESHLRGLFSDPSDIARLRASGETQLFAAHHILLGTDRAIRGLLLEQGVGAPSRAANPATIETRYIQMSSAAAVDPAAVRRSEPAIRIDLLRVHGAARVEAFLVEPVGVCEEARGLLLHCDRVMVRVAERKPGGPLQRTRLFAFESLLAGQSSGPEPVAIPEGVESVEVLIRRRSDAAWAAGRADQVLRVGMSARGDVSAAPGALGNLVAIKSPADLSFFTQQGAEIQAERFTLGHEKWYDLGEHDPARILVTGTGEGTYTLLLSRAAGEAWETLTIANATTAPGLVDAVEIRLSDAQRLEAVTATLSRSSAVVVGVSSASAQAASTAQTPALDVQAGRPIDIQRAAGDAWSVGAGHERATLAPQAALSIEGNPGPTLARHDVALSPQGDDPLAPERSWLIDGVAFASGRVLVLPALAPGDHEVAYVETSDGRTRVAKTTVTIVAATLVDVRDLALRELGAGAATVSLEITNRADVPVVAPLRLVGPAGATFAPQDIRLAPGDTVRVEAALTGLAPADNPTVSIGERQWTIVRAAAPAPLEPAILEARVEPDGVLSKLVVRARAGPGETRIVVRDADTGVGVGSRSLPVGAGVVDEAAFTLQPYVARVDVTLVDATSGRTLDARTGVAATIAVPASPTPVPAAPVWVLLMALCVIALATRRRR